MKNKYILKIYLILIIIFLYFPIGYLIFYSFNAGESMVEFSGFSWRWYEQLFQDNKLLVVLNNTLLLAVISAGISTIIGLIGAFSINRITNKKKKMMIYSINNIFVVAPDVVIGISLLLLFSMLTIKLGFFSVLMAHITFSIPLVVMMILPKLSSLENTIISSARDLGANDRQIVKEIILPLLIPNILASFAIVFLYSLDDFAVTFFVTGNGFSTLSLEVYNSARTGISLEINALSTIIFGLTLIVVIIYYLIARTFFEEDNEKNN